MTLGFADALDRAALARAVATVDDLVSDPEVGARWDQPSALPGMTVGGLTRHLVSQPECAVEFLTTPPPAGAEVVSLTAYADRLDWLDAPVDAPENTSIAADFDAMAGGGHPASIAVLREAVTQLPAAIAGSGPTVYVPWQDCALGLDDFLAVRLLEVVVHADDLAVSLGRPTPHFDDDVLHPVAGLLALLALRRHGQDALIRALARTERAPGGISAFGP